MAMTVGRERGQRRDSAEEKREEKGAYIQRWPRERSLRWLLKSGGVVRALRSASEGKKRLTIHGGLLGVVELLGVGVATLDDDVAAVERETDCSDDR
jgi:hypothetical protein